MVEKISKRYIISLFVTIIGLIGLISSTSYAILKGNTQSNNIQIIKAGSVQLQLEEKYNNIEIGSFVLKDADGLMQDEIYEFTITNIGSVSAKYDLKLLNTAPSGQTALSSDYIRIGLEVNGQEMGPMGLGNVNNIIDSNTINENEIVRYKMRIWLDKTKKDEIEQNSDKKAYLSLKVEAKQSTYAAKKYVYRHETDSILYNGGPMLSGSYTGYCGINTNENYNSCTTDHIGFMNEQACLTYMGGGDGISCTQGTWTQSVNARYTKDYTTLNNPYFFKYLIGDKKEILESYVCYILSNKEYCLKGGDGIYDTTLGDRISPSYQSNIDILKDSFGTENCHKYDESYYYCTLDSLYVHTRSSGEVEAEGDNTACHLFENGESLCDPI